MLNIFVLFGLPLKGPTVEEAVWAHALLHLVAFNRARVCFALVAFGAGVGWTNSGCVEVCQAVAWHL